MNRLLLKHLVLIFTMIVSVVVYSQPNSTPPSVPRDLTKAPVTTTVKPDTATQQTNATPNTKKTEEPCKCAGVQLSGNATILVFAPLTLLLLFTLLFMFWMIKSNFTLEDALSVAPTPEQYVQAAAARASLHANTEGAANQAIPDPKPQRSVSRLLAFLTGIAAIIIAICLISYQGYSIVSGCSIDKQLDAVWKILAGLGIGVIPYGINVWNGNPKETSAAKS